MRTILPHTARVLLAWVLGLGLVCVWGGGAHAHRVNVFAWVEGDTVFVEAKYPDGIKVHDGVIRVLDSSGTELLNGRTNAAGEFSFKIPKQEDLTVVLDAGMGHRADWPLSRQDLAPAGDASGPPQPAFAAAPQPAPATADPGATPASGIDPALEKVLDRKLAPILKALAELQEQKVRLTDVLGGLGYIIGLVGVAAYFKRRPEGTR
jgi:nickel transport protein